MLEYFLSFIKQHQLIARGEKTLLALSGGVDSMVMADLFLRSGYPFAVAHVNFGLRGRDSDLDEAFVKKWCTDKRITFHAEKVPEGLFSSGESIQMTARDFRYRYFRELMQQHRYQRLATAHHLDDSLETALFNFTKGTGLRGLKGIEPQNNEIIRPILFAEKQYILDYAKDQGIEWREDASNERNDYQRNKIRNQVIPVLQSINPGLTHTFLSISQRMGDAQDLVDHVTEGIVRDFTREDKGKVLINLEWMKNYLNPLIILYELLRPYGFSYAQVSQVRQTVASGSSGKLFHSGVWVLNLDREQMVLRKKVDESPEEQKLSIPGTTIIDHRSIEASVVGGNELKDHHNPRIVYVDHDKIHDPKVTRWNQGDAFYPLGMKGKKKVSDFMIDSKIPLTLKQDVLILKSGGEIVWIVGYRLDERFKVTPDTKKMLRLQVHQDV